MRSQEDKEQVLNEIVKEIKKINAKEIAEGTFCNKIFILKDGKGVGIPFEFKDRDDKENAFFTMNLLLKKIRPDMALFTSEAWFLRKKENDKDFDLNNLPLPSESPDRMECFIIFARTDNFARMVMLPFTRLEDGSLQFEEETNHDSRSGFNTYDKLFDGVFVDDIQTIGPMQ